MNILSAAEIRLWDQYTMQHEPIASIDLMERAAAKCVDWIDAKKWKQRTFRFFCGKGNNGGDGLVIARRLLEKGYTVAVYVPETSVEGSEDFQVNLRRFHLLPHADLQYIRSVETFPVISTNEIVVDALFGSGLNKPIESLTAALVDHLNHSKSIIVSIDVPSGLFMDRSSLGNTIIQARYTLSFQCYKLALLVQENAPFIGEVHILDIGLHPEFLKEKENRRYFVTDTLIKKIFKPRDPFANKGNYGHALLIAGSYGKIGAAVLCARSCLRSGVGLLTCYIPQCGYQIMQTALPEAMVLTDDHEKIVAELPEAIEKYSVIGIGPGLGTADETQKLFSFIVRRYSKPLVIDADGLNCLALNKEWLILLPAHTVLTPHPKEFDRLFGQHQNDFQRMETAVAKAKELNVVLVLKSHHTFIAAPDGSQFFNSTGNAGLAKAGSGDVLTGIITAMLSQKYEASEAAVLSVYLHGLAGDLAANELSQESMIAGDLIEYLTKAFAKMK
ncbi:MAG: NAD(P)H-hydrate dehydratase [Flavisolibacter sp.]